jgi:RHS repeat-associated protein
MPADSITQALTEGRRPERSAPAHVGGTSVSHDAAGNVLNDQPNSYTYDAEGRMVYASQGAWWESSLYNALGQRVTETMPDGQNNRTLIYPRDIFGHRTEIFDYRPSWNWVGADQFWARVEGVRLLMGGSTSLLRHADAVGSTTMITDQTGAVNGDVIYYPWGQVWKGGANNGYAFGDLGFQINYPLPPSATRDYNPGLGRWMSPDPAGEMAVSPANPQTWNMYAYVTDNPTSLNEPSGLESGGADCGSWGGGSATVAINGQFTLSDEVDVHCLGDGDGIPIFPWFRQGPIFGGFDASLQSAYREVVLISAQNAAMNNPLYAPGYHGSTWCNYGTCDVARAMGAPMAALTHPNGVTYPAALIVANLAKPDSGWREVSGMQAQTLASEGQIVIAAWDHHVATIRPAGVPGDKMYGAGSYAPWVANVGWKNTTMGVNYAFPGRVARAGEVHFYTPEH